MITLRCDAVEVSAHLRQSAHTIYTVLEFVTSSDEEDIFFFLMGGKMEEGDEREILGAFILQEM